MKPNSSRHNTDLSNRLPFSIELGFKMKKTISKREKRKEKSEKSKEKERILLEKYRKKNPNTYSVMYLLPQIISLIFLRDVTSDVSIPDSGLEIKVVGTQTLALQELINSSPKL